MKITFNSFGVLVVYETRDVIAAERELVFTGYNGTPNVPMIGGKKIVRGALSVVD